MYANPSTLEFSTRVIARRVPVIYRKLGGGTTNGMSAEQAARFPL